MKDKMSKINNSFLKSAMTKDNDLTTTDQVVKWMSDRNNAA